MIQPIVIDATFGFLFAGIVPGTDIVLPFWAMSLVLASVGLIALNWLMGHTLYIGDSAYEQRRMKKTARQYIRRLAGRRVSPPAINFTGMSQKMSSLFSKWHDTLRPQMKLFK